LQQKVAELVADSSAFAMGGAIQNALENLWLNLPFVPRSCSIDAMRARYQGLPAVIIASGPSLQKNIHLLNEIQSRAILISCGSALGPLWNRGITPHFEVVVDPYPAMYEVLKPHLASPTCFLLSLMSHHRISQECTGQRMYFLVNFGAKSTEDLKRLTLIQTVLPAMASVATTALFFALHAGCNPIIFVGLDLCYTDGRPRIDSDAAPEASCTLETLDGRRVLSNPALKEAFDFFSDFVPTIKDRKIVNATEGGAGIRGAEQVSLAEASARYLERTIMIPDSVAIKLPSARWKTELKALHGSFSAMYIKAAGFRRKMLAHRGAGKDKAAINTKITEWFDSLRTMPGYGYLANYLDWAYYRADTSDDLDLRLEFLSKTEQMLQQQIGQIEEVIKT